jgi:zinc transport system substrate-binding protein
MDRRLTLALAITALAVVGLGVAYAARPQPQPSGKLAVVATFYPLAYFAEAIGGDAVEVTALIPPGVEPHSWQPSAGDLVACSDARVILYNGAGLDDWLSDDIVPSIDASGKLIVDTTANVTLWRNVEAEEIAEHGVYDPHTWVSPYEARQQVEAVYRALVSADPSNTDYYTQRWGTLSAKLTQLDTDYTAQLAGKTRDTIYVTHDAFSYTARRYGFQQASIVGVSADQQPSTETLIQIIDEMQQTGTYTFYVEPGYSDAYVQTVKAELEARTGETIQVLKLYHMNGPQDGFDYLAQMEKNLENLRMGLG